MEFDLSLVTDSLPLLLQGALVTLEITALAVGLGLVFGLVAALAQLSKFAPLRLTAKVYVDFIRGTPLLVQIFIIYFALPVVIGHRIDPFFAAVAACSINSGAYVAEIFRAGIQSIDIGQMRAGLSLGMNWTMTMRYIILPQTFKTIIPALFSQCTTVIKDSSYLSGINVAELMYTANVVMAHAIDLSQVLMLYGLVFAMYFVLNFGISLLVRAYQRRIVAA